MTDTASGKMLIRRFGEAKMLIRIAALSAFYPPTKAANHRVKC